MAAKLEAAREVLHTLDVGQFVLDAAEGVPGAAKKLADFRTTIAAAQRDVGELEQAHTLADKLDRATDAAGAIQLREEQLREFKALLAKREAGMKTALDGLATAAAGYADYAAATLLAAGMVPSGTHVPTMNLGPDGLLGSAFGYASGQHPRRDDYREALKQ